uniref:NADH dehydrogenase subunit 6 n=1 Tax=Synorthocladius bifidus TaxID=3095015 RepID=UPI002E79F020|nr:NADH dehydrogenase subunit 6 [Synorthocladius bifidus]WPM93124.1 NADH dehydrogenase subunit 6 [Synorthocladius bifidus]
MFNLFIYLMSMICSMIFSIMKHPLAMGLMLLIQTLIICLLSGFVTKTFWFSYILFLIFLGGMLVLFIYVTSLASNEMFNFSIKIFSFSLLILMLNFILFFFVDKNLIMNYLYNMETKNITLLKSYFLENSIMMNKLYNFPINLITIMLMIYLFLTLIAVVKITNIFEGPLRPKSN